MSFVTTEPEMPAVAAGALRDVGSAMYAVKEPVQARQRESCRMAPESPAPIDTQGFGRAMDELRATMKASLGQRDLDHFRRMERWGRLCSIAGYATAWIAPNPISAFLMSLGNTTRWTIMMHHVAHGGLDRVPNVPARYTSDRFAQGSRRFVDWLDWIHPEAWHQEHKVHHYRTGEVEDPDLVEDNVRLIRELRAPAVFKYAAIAFIALTWKLSYYAPNTFKTLCVKRRRRAGLPGVKRDRGWFRRIYPWIDQFNFRTDEGREFWRRCVLPYGIFRFVLLPGLFLPLGPVAAANVLANSLLAEALTNLHSFLIIVTNHAGDDVHRFDTRARSRAEFYVRQVMGSVNFTDGGNDLSDFLLGYLNYQIEHHLFPDLPPLKYREVQPQVKAICAQYGVPYVEDTLLNRVRKLFLVISGETSMKREPLQAHSVAAGQ
jgi:fatty acid desaturase